MLKVTGLSLLLGIVASVAVLTSVFAPPVTDGPQPSPVKLNATNAVHMDSAATFSDGELPLELPGHGRTFVSLTTGGINAEDYPFLHLALADLPDNLMVSISFSTDRNKGRAQPYLLETGSAVSVWLAMDELAGWTGTVDLVTIHFHGTWPQIIRIKNLSLHPTSPQRQLQTIYSDLVSNAIWKRADMNTHTGVSKMSPFYPVPLVVTLLLLSTLAYGLLLLLFRSKLQFNWTVVALLFLACWISLDMVWQNNLLQQVGYTYRTFSGKSTQEKLAVGPDSELFNFISEVKQHVESPDARILVSTNDIYKGMRGAYYLYPFNVFWSLEPPEIPADRYLRKGDYIVLIHPTETHYFAGNGKLKAPENVPHNAECLIKTYYSCTLARLK